jgi:predicted transcriptional regulator of viral defense system
MALTSTCQKCIVIGTDLTGETMGLAHTYRRTLRERALDQYGYVSTADAAELGVPSVELRKLAARGGLARRGFGLYRFEDIPLSGRDQFMEAVLLVGPGAFLIDESVLDLHNLGLVNPNSIHVGTHARVRRRMNGPIVVTRMSPEPSDLTVYEGIPCLRLARALLGCRGRIMGERLIVATREAREGGLLSRAEAQTVLTALGVDARLPWAAELGEVTR